MLVDLRDATAATCGAKAGTLARLARAGFRVPGGFVLPFGAGEVPDGELARWLARLGDPPVAVRSSASAEDGSAASAAGQHDSFLGVRGVGAVAEAVRACRASLTSERAVAYRRAAGAAGDLASGVAADVAFDAGADAGAGVAAGAPVAVEMAVLVQRHVDAEVAGVLFTGEPAHGTRSVSRTGPPEPARVDASWGLGESVVHGLVTPDAWTVSPAGVEARSVGDKRTRIDRGAAGLVTAPVPAADRDRPCLDDAQVVRLVALGAELANALGMPLDVEWAVAGGEIWILQARPITAALPPSPAGRPAAADGEQVIRRGAQSRATAPEPGSGPRHGVVLSGVPGSAGTATGPARLIAGPADFGRAAPGDVIVCRTTDPAWTPLLTVAAAVVTETGGVLAHAAIVARERRIPAVLGVPDALTVITDGEPVTVDGAAGTVSRAARY